MKLTSCLTPLGLWRAHRIKSCSVMSVFSTKMAYDLKPRGYKEETCNYIYIWVKIISILSSFLGTMMSHFSKACGFSLIFGTFLATMVSEFCSSCDEINACNQPLKWCRLTSTVRNLMRFPLYYRLPSYSSSKHYIWTRIWGDKVKKSIGKNTLTDFLHKII